MNVLLVDDQKAIVDSLKSGIKWEKLPVETVYTACSAREAKLVLTNFAVDVLVTDIEMPEEDGLSLCSWAKSHIPGLECIFLTSHADFDYAKEAIQMGSFDYILQPVRYEDVEKSLMKAWHKIREDRRVRQIVDSQKRAMEQRNVILDAMMSKAARGRMEDCDAIYGHFCEVLRLEYEESVICPVLIQVLRWKKITEIWEESLVRLVFCNVLEELFSGQQCRAGISSIAENQYWIFLIFEKRMISRDILEKNLEIFSTFIDDHMDFSIAVYPGGLLEGSFSLVFPRLQRRLEYNAGKKRGIFWEDPEPEQKPENENAVEQALCYIRKNLSRNISRTDVAEYVHLNEEYFSRLFRQQTGATFKDYVLSEKMKEAQKLLEHSRLSVSIVASKIGYDNFSHFSKMFKKVTGQTPQEYRKKFQNPPGKS